MPPIRRLSLLAATVLALPACGAGGLPAKATVSTIDRTCDIVTTTMRKIDDPRGVGARIEAQEKDTHKGECKSVDEWEDVRTKKKERVSGTALVHVGYKAPQDGSYDKGTLRFSGLDDEFYDLKAGDEIEIRVAKDDPPRIWKA